MREYKDTEEMLDDWSKISVEAIKLTPRFNRGQTLHR